MGLYLHVFIDPFGAVELEGELATLGTVFRDPEFLAAQWTMVESTPDTMYSLSLPDQALEWGRQFIGQILKEIRAVVCENSKEYLKYKKEYRSYSKAFAVAVSSAVLNSLGITGPLALGLATVTLLVLAHATQNAFCKMTDEEVLKAIESKVEADRQRKSDMLHKAFGDVLEKPKGVSPKKPKRKKA
jgi:hypothetical protein